MITSLLPRLALFIFVISVAVINCTRPGCGTGGIVSLSEIDGTNGYRIDVTSGTGGNGHAIGAVGDADNDGVPDILVGVFDSTPKASPESGSATLVYGSSDLTHPKTVNNVIDMADGYRIDGSTTEDYLGYSVSPAGDVNGDGIDDFIIGMNGYDTFRGGACVIFGLEGKTTILIRASAIDGTNGFIIEGITPAAREGIIVKAAGDVNNDGYDDVIIGSHFLAQSGGVAEGEIHVVYGSANPSHPLLLDSIDGSNGFAITASGLGFGSVVCGVGDMNGDGFADIAIGLSLSDSSNHGSVFTEGGVVYGILGGSALGSSVAAQTLDTGAGFRVMGASEGANVGTSLAGADVNGDGFSDLIIGSSGVSDGAGAAYVMFGAASIAKGVDVSTADITVLGLASGDAAGGAVSSAGDFNGDGFEDILIGAAGADPSSGGDGAGEAYLIYGGLTVSGSVDLSGLDGSNGLRFEGAESGHAAGSTVAAAADVNSDGFVDIIISAPGANNGRSGVSYVVMCAPTGPTASPTPAPTGPTFSPTIAPTEAAAATGSTKADDTLLVLAGVGGAVAVLLLGFGWLYTKYNPWLYTKYNPKPTPADPMPHPPGDVESGPISSEAVLKPRPQSHTLSTGASKIFTEDMAGTEKPGEDILSELPGTSALSSGLLMLQANAKSLFIDKDALVLGSVLGKGGFGTVCRATMQYQTVAVKQYQCDRLPEKVMDEVCNEVKVMKDLRHVNLVALLGVVDNAQSAPWLVMEYCGGGGLYHLLYSNVEMPWPLRLRLVGDIISGLVYLHQQQIVHCDMKSANVLLTEGKRGKLADFGLSVVRDHSTTTMHGSGGGVGGTVRWMAPELFTRQFAKPSRASDVWAFGMILFEIAARKLPFAEGNDVQIRGWLKDGELEKVPGECLKEAPGLGEVMERCWRPRLERAAAMELAPLIFELLPKEEEQSPVVNSSMPDASASASMFNPYEKY